MRLSRILGLGLILLLSYLLLWPTAIDPVAWTSPTAPGYAGAFAPNTRLAKLERLPLAGFSGAEDLAQAPSGWLYASTHEGNILRLKPDGTSPTVFVKDLGRPLGIEADAEGRLLVADAYRGLLSVTASGAVSVLATECENKPILYADDVAVSKDSDVIYLSDASTKFGAKAFAGTLPASKVDMLEHGGHGRIMEYRRSTGKIRTLLDGLQFANGLALNEAGTKLIIVETGRYRVLVYHLEGPNEGTTEVLVDNLPGFPDNVDRGPNGLFWVGLVSARSPPLDMMAQRPLLRKITSRLPTFIQPDIVPYGHVFAITEAGQMKANLQDPTGAYAKTTGAFVAGPWLFITSLSESSLGRIPADPKWSATTPQ